MQLSSFQKPIIYALLLASVSISSYLILDIVKFNNRQHKLNDHNPDAFMTDIIAAKMDTTGSLHDTLYSPKGTHYPDNDTTDFTTPHIISYPKTGEPWHITSIYGKAYGNNKVVLWDKVNITRASGPQNKDVSLKTSLLTYFPKTDYAETNRFAILKQSGSTIQAVGVEAYLKQNYVKLLSNVQGFYINPTPTQTSTATKAS